MVTATATIPELRFFSKCGHPMSTGNTYVDPRNRPFCWTCKRIHKAEYRERAKATQPTNPAPKIRRGYSPEPKPEESPMISQGWLPVTAPAHLTKAEDIVRHAAREHERIRNIDKTTVAIVYDDTMVCQAGEIIVRVGGEHEPKCLSQREVYLR